MPTLSTLFKESQESAPPVAVKCADSELLLSPYNETPQFEGKINHLNAKAVDRYLNAALTQSQDRLTWDQKAAVLVVAKKGLGEHPYRWFEYNVMDGFSTYRWLDFMEDTIRFIEKGSRRVSIQTWRELYPEPTCANEEPQGLNLLDIEKSYPDLVVYMKQCKINDLLVKWCEKPKGFQDLALTMDILFGSFHPRKIEPRGVERLTFRLT